MNEPKKVYDDKSPRITYPFGFSGKKYNGQKTEVIKCNKCGKSYEVTVQESADPDYMGKVHALNPSMCPFCSQKWWYRDGFEKS